MKITDRNMLAQIKSDHEKKQPKQWIKVGYSTCGIAAGADVVFEALTAELKKRNIDIPVLKCGCAGMCYAEPLVEVCVDGAPRVFYGKVNKEVVHHIVEQHVGQHRLLDDHIYDLQVQSA